MTSKLKSRQNQTKPALPLTNSSEFEASNHTTLIGLNLGFGNTALAAEETREEKFNGDLWM